MGSGNIDDVHIWIFDQVLVGSVGSGCGLLSRQDDLGDEVLGRGQGRGRSNGGDSVLYIIDVARLR